LIRQDSRVRDFAMLDWANLRGECRNNRNRFAVERDKLDFVSRAAAMNQDNGANITARQAVIRQIFG
jgi:hypothetical protein